MQAKDRVSHLHIKMFSFSNFKKIKVKIPIVETFIGGIA